MKANAAAPELVLLNEEDYPDELTEFFAYIRELDAEGGPHWARVDEGELRRFAALLGGSTKQEGQIQRRERGRKAARRKSTGIQEE